MANAKIVSKIAKNPSREIALPLKMATTRERNKEAHVLSNAGGRPFIVPVPRGLFCKTNMADADHRI